MRIPISTPPVERITSGVVREQANDADCLVRRADGVAIKPNFVSEIRPEGARVRNQGVKRNRNQGVKQKCGARASGTNIKSKMETVEQSCTVLLSVDFEYCSRTERALSKRSTITKQLAMVNAVQTLKRVRRALDMSGPSNSCCTCRTHVM